MLFDAVVTAEIDGLRRALGEPDLGRIPPHLTLIPPVNVRDVEAAERVLRAAAQGGPPIVVELGPVMTFLPDNPVAYLAVGGDVDAVVRLRDRAFQPPLERELTWPYVPHVTVADGIDVDRIRAAPDVLGAYVRQTTLRDVTLL
ncbi:MAG TPA: 2'-5' RNA ligase family protein, partial [Acidimicrobiales bacterium]|nr:2'-5' RNA ligase family protein [Acidimicrobiales bacterium]